MIFIISRTSIFRYDEEGNKVKPCEEAIMRKVEEWHCRTCNEEEFNKRFSQREGLWRAKGRNHQTTKQGYILRQEDDVEEWTIELNSLEEIQAFSMKYGELIIEFSEYGNRQGSIEIYDDYCE